ncbi:restriction endonuclease subunit S [Halomonas tibetensis]|uniref:Restriction endonuclease subunit S n=1 Tax=Halomonas tibetensis TaxID=2259590 RepID=A0ABV7B6R5_9GAMM
MNVRESKLTSAGEIGSADVSGLLIDHLDLWSGAVTTRSTAGRGRHGKIELTGIKKLRELILELAVRGKLVEQDPSDEPAGVLLERIAEEKARLVKEGKIKKPKKLPEITEEEKPFELPEGWQWARLSDVLRVINGRAYKKHEMLQEGTPLLRVGNLFTSNEWYYSDLQLEDDKYIDHGDLIYAWSASFGPFIWDGGKAIYHYHIWKLELYDHLYTSKHFLYNYLKAVTEEIKSSGSGIAMTHMTKAKMEELVLPFPPPKEQQRIVEKIDELMALCDRLEQQVGDQLEAHEVLVDTLLGSLFKPAEGSLTRSTDAAEVVENWARISEHFDTLFTTEASIDKLKQTILQLAVMGRLVEQDPNDEPAIVLLDRIAEEKARLVNEGKIKKSKVAPESQEEIVPFKIPGRWKWCRLENITLYSESGWSPQCNNGPRSEGNWGVLKVSAVSWGNFKPDENKGLPKNLAPRAELEVRPSDFLISRANTADLVARSVVVPTTTPEKLMLSDKIIRVVFSKYIHQPYVNIFNNSQYAREYYSSVAGGTSHSMKNVSRSQINQLLTPLPPFDEQVRICKAVENMLFLCEAIRKKLHSLEKLKEELANGIVRKASGDK